MLLVAVLMACSSMGCGDADGEGSGEDFFYVYVVHGYAGQGELSVYGSAGPLATGLNYGEIAGDPDNAARPLKVDRARFDGNVQILLSGATEVATIALDSFAFYPGETVTLFLTRRSGPNTYDLRVMRHNQVANRAPTSRLDEDSAYNCVLSVANGLSLSNVYTPNAFDIQLQWQLPTPPTDPNEPNPTAPQLNRLVYDAMRDQNVETVCGPLSAGDFAMAPMAAQSAISQAIATRTMILQQITPTSWYYMVRGESGFLEFRLAQWIAPDGGGATVTGWRSSREYQQCVGGAVQVPVIMNSSGAVDCDRMKFNEIQVDDVRLRECNRPVTYAGITISPGDPNGQTFYVRSGDGQTCNFKFRPRTRNVDLVFNHNGMDSLAEFQANYPINSWQYFTFFGDPVSPFAYSLNSKQDANGVPTTGSALAEIAVPLNEPANNGAPTPAQ